jgi:hypothetical protein
VRSFYDPSEPLEGQTLLLEVHFWGLRIYAGVRVSAAYDATHTSGGATEHVAVWSYDTLQGHFEQGRISYVVSKRLNTGLVEFHIEAVSRRADPGNLLVAAGFAAFGRRKQQEFARSACERMWTLAHAVLAGEAAPKAGALDERVAVEPDPDKQTGPQRATRFLRRGS